MSAQTSWPLCPIGAWTQLCEQKEGRKSLLIQLIGGACVLAFSTASPTINSGHGLVPAGVWHSEDTGNGPGTFSLSAARDGELVEQAWFAWPIASTLPPGPVFTTVVFNASAGPFALSGATSIVDAYAWGGGGAGWSNPNNMFGGGGGGGGGFASTGPQNFALNAQWSVQVGAAGSGLPTTITAPGGTIIASANSGVTATTTSGAAGGAGTIGARLFAGGHGAVAPGVGTGAFGQGGGCAGSFANGGDAGVLGPGVEGVGGGTVTLGIYGPGGNGQPNNNGTPTWPPPGGGGAGNGLGLVATPPQPGRVVFGYYQFTGNPVAPNITVCEAFDTIVPPDPPKMFSVPLPSLSPEALVALHDMIARVQARQAPTESEPYSG